MKFLAYSTAAFLIAAPASAGEIILAIGADDLRSDDGSSSIGVAAEIHADPFFERGRGAYSFGAVLEVDEDGDVFVGGGVHANWSLGTGPWFIEGSLMPGYYSQGQSGTDLGGNLQFRTVLGLGYELTSGSKISLAIDHKSNAAIEDFNPGGEMLMLRYSFKF